MKIFRYLLPFLTILLAILVMILLVWTVAPLLLNLIGRFPLETLIIVGIFFVSVLAVVLYIWELVVIGWAVDFLESIGMPKPRAGPLEYEQIGEIIVVTLRDNVGTVFHCQSVQKQLKILIDEHYCDFVVDFLQAGRISHRLREVLVYLAKAAPQEAVRLGRPCGPLPRPRRAAFQIFDDRKRAVEEMSKHDGHGWVALCSIPVGIRAVAGLT